MGNPVILFDLDGTIAKTDPKYLHMLFQRVLQDFGKEATEEETNRFFFSAHRNSVIKEMFEIDAVKFWERYDYHNVPEAREAYVRGYDDVAFLCTLKERGYDLGIVTGAMPDMAQMETEAVVKDALGRKASIDELFGAVVSANDRAGGKFKPNPWGIYHCMRLMKASPKDVLMYVGDGDEDIDCARRSDVTDVLVDRGEHNHLSLVPTYKINTITELDRILR